MNVFQPYSIFPLGDSALTIDFGNAVQEDINKKVLRLYHHVHSAADPLIGDLVPAYSSLTVYYDAARLYSESKTAFECMADRLDEILARQTLASQHKAQYFEIPVCYSKKFALDLEYLAGQSGMPQEEVVHIHSSKIYRVYMLGFLPGFCYMGDVDRSIALPRKPVPVTVFPGAVGIAGSQTGIYPLTSPGGWQIIGRTPVEMFNRNSPRPVWIQPGDQIKFYPVTLHEFENYQTRNT